MTISCFCYCFKFSAWCPLLQSPGWATPTSLALGGGWGQTYVQEMDTAEWEHLVCVEGTEGRGGGWGEG